MKPVLSILLGITFALALPLAAQKQTPPPPAPPRPFSFPSFARKTLPNGLTVFVVEDHRLPLVSASLYILAGNALVPPEKAGLAGITAGLLREGTTTLSSQEIARKVDGAGGSLGASAGDDTASVNMNFMKSYAELGMTLMSDIVRNPAFAQEEIDRQMRQAQSGLAVQYQDPAYLAPMVAARAILGTHPYAYPGDGTPQTLRNIKREDIQAFYKANYAPGRAWMAVAGDVTPDEGFAMAEKYFGSWKNPAPADVKLPAPPAQKPQVYIIDMPDAVQTQIIIGQVGVPRNHPDYIPLQLANQVLGSGMSSRLFLRVRANEGLTYDASSSFEANRQSGIFTMSTSTRTEKTADAIRLLLGVLADFKTNPPTEAEYTLARDYMVGVFALSIESAGAVAGRVLNTAIFGLPEDYYATYRERVRATTREQVAAAIQKFFLPEKQTIVLVGNAEKFAKEVESFGPARIVKGSDLDLVAPGMVKIQDKPAATPESAAAARALFDAAVTAAGGKEKVLAVKDQVLKGKLKITMPQGTMEADVVEEILPPDYYKMTLTLPMGTMTQALDGKTGWMAQGQMSRDMPANMTAELAKSVPTSGGGLGLLTDYLQGKAQVSALSADTALWKSGDFEVKLTFDPKTHQITKMVYNSIGMAGPAEMQAVLSDFKAIDGLTLPFREEIVQNGQPFGDRTISERRINAGLKPESFAKPKPQ
jgi:predicted Zn-dependent peptidase